MPSLSLPERLIWFAHCPKAGGTSVEQFMVARWGDAVGHLHWGWDLWWKQGGWREADPPNSPQHLIWDDALRQLPKPPDAVFAVVRRPEAQIQSEYRWQRQGRRGTLLGRSLAHLPFSFWLRLMLAMQARHPGCLDNHLRPQVDFVPSHATVFRLENGLDRAVAWLSAETGLSYSAVVPHAIMTGPSAGLRSTDMARIIATYEADYDRFGYERPPAPAVVPDLADRVAAVLSHALVALDRRGCL